MVFSCAAYDAMEIALSRSTLRSLSRARRSLPARLPWAVRVKQRNCFGTWSVLSPRTVYRCESHVTFLMPSPPAGASEDDPADEMRLVACDELGDHAAHREPVQVYLLQAESPSLGPRSR